MNIPVTKPFFDEAEFSAVLEPLKSGWVVQGPKVKEFEERFAAYTRASHAVAASSCTSALHLTLVALGIGSGDEVIVPSFTWVATANVAVYQGAHPIFVDIDLDTFNIAPEKIEEKITPRTIAIIPVHLFGLSADMNPIMEIARRHSLYVVEDAACALGTTYRGQHVGVIGDVGCFSFHPRKSITTGEGGMLTTNRAELAEQFRVLRTHGAMESDLARHQNGKFGLAEFNVLGYNYRMTDIQAAIGIAQMGKLAWILAQRCARARRYDEALANIEWLQLPTVPAGYEHTYQSYVAVVKDGAPLDRDELARRLQQAGISSRPGTLAVHNVRYYRTHCGTRPEDCPMALKAEQQSLTLPLYPTMTDEEQDYVVETLRRMLRC
jgi:dTDP-4-amino-4,6-dideoxygalactose transaminase